MRARIIIRAKMANIKRIKITSTNYVYNIKIYVNSI